MDDRGLTLGRIDELIAERTSALEHLRRAAVMAERELHDLDTTRQVLLRYMGGGGATATAHDSVPALPPTEVASPGSGATEGPQRIRSTQLVTDVVRRAGRPLTRDQVLEEFRARDLVPASWTNPRNAINNALARAAQRGQLRLDEETGAYRSSDAAAEE